MNKVGILEGLLFLVGDEGLTLEQIIDIMDVNEEEAKTTLMNLRKNYESEDRGIRVNFLGNTFKLTTKEDNKEYYERLLENPQNRNLSQAALETLAIIAYNEPVTRIKIDELRGVSSGHIIRKLIVKDLIKEIGRSDLPGRPILYKTTNAFLDYFGLGKPEDLPPIEPIKDQELEETDLFYQNRETNQDEKNEKESVQISK